MRVRRQGLGGPGGLVGAFTLLGRFPEDGQLRAIRTRLPCYASILDNLEGDPFTQEEQVKFRQSRCEQSETKGEFLSAMCLHLLRRSLGRFNYYDVSKDLW